MIPREYHHLFHDRLSDSDGGLSHRISCPRASPFLLDRRFAVTVRTTAPLQPACNDVAAALGRLSSHSLYHSGARASLGPQPTAYAP